MTALIRKAGNWFGFIGNGRRNGDARPAHERDDYDPTGGSKETAYLLSSPANRKRLLETIVQIEGKSGEWRLKNLDKYDR